MICKILGPFLNTLIAHDKYFVFNGDNLMQRIQMQLSKKQKNLSQFFSAFLKSSSKFEHFKKHDEHHSLHISQITDCERHG